MIRTMTVAALVLALAACGAPAPDEQEQALADAQHAAEADTQPATEPAPAPAEACDALQAQWTVGKTLTETELEQARKDAGAQTVRTLAPGQVVTMEFLADRLNLELDDQGAVVSVRCG